MVRNKDRGNSDKYGAIPKGGTIAVSHNNPGNIKFGKFTKKYGAWKGRPGTDGGDFAVFPDVQTGLQAQRDLWKVGRYQNSSVERALRVWSGGGKDSSLGYGVEIYPELKGKKISELTDSEMRELQRRQIKREDGNMYKILTNTGVFSGENTNPIVTNSDNVVRPVATDLGGFWKAELHNFADEYPNIGVDFDFLTNNEVVTPTQGVNLHEFYKEFEDVANLEAINSARENPLIETDKNASNIQSKKKERDFLLELANTEILEEIDYV